MLNSEFEKSIIGAIGHNADAMTMFANAKIFYNALMEMPQCIQQITIPGVCIKNTTFDVDCLANAYAGCGDDVDECKKHSLDGDIKYDEGSFFADFFKLNNSRDKV